MFLLQRRRYWLVALLPLLSIAACSDFKESHYSRMAEARRAGAIDRGWLPDLLPDNTTNVREVHDIDTSQTWCAFDLAEPEATKLQAGMSLLGRTDVLARTIRAPGVGWWPKVLEGRLDPNSLEQASMRLYSSGRLLFAFHVGTGRGFMYRDSAR